MPAKWDWDGLIEDWREERKKRVDQPIFYYIDHGDYLEIYDKRDSNKTKNLVLAENEKEIFLACHDVISFQKLQEQFPNIPKNKLIAILERFVHKEIMFREDDSYFSLPLHYNHMKSQRPKRKKSKKKKSTIASPA